MSSAALVTRPEPATGGQSRPDTRRTDAAPSRGAALIVPAAIALGVLALSLENGGYDAQVRGGLAIAAWWALALGLLLGTWPRTPLTRGGRTAAGGLAAFAGWTALSALWATDAGAAVAEGQRALLAAGLFAIALAATRPGDAGRWADGLALGIAASAGIALASRLLPGLGLGGDPLIVGVPSRLSWPLGYWNGLGVLAALGVPLCVRSALAARSSIARGAAIAVVPVLAATVYLTSSRNGIGTAVIGLAVLVALAPSFARAAGAAAIAAGASIAGIAVVAAHPVVVDGPFGTAAATTEGRQALVALVAICLAAGVVHGLTSGRLPRRTGFPRAVRIGLAVAALAGVAVALAAADPAGRFDRFRQPPAAALPAKGGFTSAHLLSSAGSGRWQFWKAAADQFDAHPLAGGGAGSFEAWWAQHGSLSYFVRDAHSLWVETLGELGLIGLLALLTAIGAALAAGLSRLRGADDDTRVTIAALVAVVAGFCFAASFDWMWEETVVAAVAVIALALLAGPASLRSAGPARPIRLGRVPLDRAAGVVALLAVAALTVPFLAGERLVASQDAAARGDLVSAQKDALASDRLAPWSARAPLQLALLRERAGDLAGARHYAAEAQRRAPSDWRGWLLGARLAIVAGDARAASAQLSRAIELNPRSPLLAGLAEAR